MPPPQEIALKFLLALWYYKKTCVRFDTSISEEVFGEVLLYLCVLLNQTDTVLTWRQMCMASLSVTKSGELLSRVTLPNL